MAISSKKEYGLYIQKDEAVNAGGGKDIGLSILPMK